MNAHQKNAYYKYRPLYQFGSSGREPHAFTRSLLQDAQIYYSAPKDFNDPFDCNLRLHARDSTDAEWGQFCDSLIADHGDPNGHMAKIKAEKLWLSDPRLVETIGEDTLKANYEESSVFCLSKKGNSIPMFSYYADSHRGIAVEFKFSGVEIPCGIAFEDRNKHGIPFGGKVTIDHVKYPASFPELNYHRLRGKTDLLINLIFTKHHEWAHEDEIRIFRRRVPASVVKFDKKLITRVIFGCNTTAVDVEMVKAWLVDWPTDVILAKAEKATNQFDLAIVDFDSVKGVGDPRRV